MSSFQDGLSYSLFKTITDQFLRGVDTRGESEVRARGFKAALAIDVTAKLNAIDNHPMNKVLGFGAKYLRENFSPWVQQHGGWVSAYYFPKDLPGSQRRGDRTFEGFFFKQREHIREAVLMGFGHLSGKR